MLIAWVILPFTGESGYPLSTGAANALITPVYSVMVGAGFIYLVLSPIAPLRSFFGMMVGRVAAGLQKMVQMLGEWMPLMRLPMQNSWIFVLLSSIFVLLAAPRLLGKKRWLRWNCLVLAGCMLAASFAAAKVNLKPRVVVIGSGYETAVWVEDSAESALIADRDVFGAADAVASGYHGKVHTIVFIGKRLADLEAILQEFPQAQRVVMAQGYAQTCPEWVNALMERYRMKSVLLKEDEMIAMGNFTIQMRERSALLMKDTWNMTCGGEAVEGSIHVVPYASRWNEKRAEKAAEIVYAQPYSHNTLDESLINGYNTIREGVWVKEFP